MVAFKYGGDKAKFALRSALLGGGAALWLAGATVAQAVPVDLSNFVVTETAGFPGQYTVYNNSDVWSVYRLTIEHDPFASSPTANRTDWDASSCGSCVGGSGDGFVYDNSSYTNLIGPHQQSDPFDFAFNTVAVASEYVLELVNLSNNETASAPGTAVAAATPLPATLPLLGSVLGFGWVATRMRKVRALFGRAAVPA